MLKKEPLFTVPHLIIAILSVSVIVVVVIFAINPKEMAGKKMDANLSKLASSENPLKDCASIGLCDYTKFLVNGSCFAPNSFYYKKKYLAEEIVIVIKEGQEKKEIEICDPKAQDWQSLSCFVCL